MDSHSSVDEDYESDEGNEDYEDYEECRNSGLSNDNSSNNAEEYSFCPHKRLDEMPNDDILTKFKELSWKAKLIFSLIIILAITFGIGYYEYTKLITVQYSEEDLLGKEYITVVDELRASGFSQVKVNEIADLPIQLITSENLVSDIKIGWITSFSKYSRLPSNLPVMVTYHTLKTISTPMSSKEAKGKNYEEVVKAFEDAGFVSIKIEIKYDIITGWLTDEGAVASVLIGEKDNFSSSSMFRPDEIVTITYHSLWKNKPD